MNTVLEILAEASSEDDLIGKNTFQTNKNKLVNAYLKLYNSKRRSVTLKLLENKEYIYG